MNYQKLFNYMSEQHGVDLLETDMQEICNIVNEIQPTTPHLSAEEFLKKYHNNSINDWLFQNKEVVAKLLQEYRSQPTPTPEVSAEEYAEMMDRDWMIPKTVLKHTITALELAGVDATYYKQALEYLKNK